MSFSSESRRFTEQNPPYPQEVRAAWTDILISCWEEGNEDYINLLRSDPLQELQGNAIIDGSDGKYFPLPTNPPNGVPKPDTVEGEAALREILKENFPHFGQMMISGGWPDNDVDTWIDIIIRAWKDPGFLQRLRDNPKETLERDYPSISASIGKFFPITKERPEALKGLSEDELRNKLNNDEPGYMGWMMTCCR
jgi:hypothetical protein